MKFNILCLFAGMLPVLCAQQLSERGVLRVSLQRAVEIGLSPEGSVAIQLAREDTRQAQAKSMAARAELLPDLDGTASVQSQTRNLSAMGLQFDQVAPGLNIPRSVGPYNVFDARFTIDQSILDLSSIRRFQASKIGVKAARTTEADTKDQAAARISRLYVAALRAEASQAAVKENIRLAEAVLKQAESLNTAGTGTGIEVTRARVLLANENQRRLVAENDLNQARQELMRAMGVSPSIDLELTDELAYVLPEVKTLDQWREIALKSRSDLQAQMEKQDQARMSSSASKLERMPTVKGFADYGSLGTGVDSAVPTRSVGFSVNVPIFDGGRRQSRILESDSKHRQEQIRTHDLRDQIETQLQLALDSLHSAEQEVNVAQEGLSLSEREMDQARHRYTSGVATSVEVADAQARLSQARDNRVAALYRHNLARLNLADATGTIQSFVQ